MSESEESKTDEEGVSYVRIRSPKNLLEEFEKRIRKAKEEEFPNEYAVKVVKLLVRILEQRDSNSV